jgi:hypothetical protein
VIAHVALEGEHDGILVFEEGVAHERALGGPLVEQQQAGDVLGE